jgi:hypothetical protein
LDKNSEISVKLLDSDTPSLIPDLANTETVNINLEYKEYNQSFSLSKIGEKLKLLKSFNQIVQNIRKNANFDNDMKNQVKFNINNRNVSFLPTSLTEEQKTLIITNNNTTTIINSNTQTTIISNSTPNLSSTLSQPPVVYDSMTNNTIYCRSNKISNLSPGNSLEARPRRKSFYSQKRLNYCNHCLKEITNNEFILEKDYKYHFECNKLINSNSSIQRRQGNKLRRKVREKIGDDGSGEISDEKGHDEDIDEKNENNNHNNNHNHNSNHNNNHNHNNNNNNNNNNAPRTRHVKKRSTSFNSFQPNSSPRTLAELQTKGILKSN